MPHMRIREAYKYYIALVALVCVAGSYPLVAGGQEYSSASYTISSPLLMPGGEGTSASYGLLGILSQPAVGTSTASSFGGYGGFLYTPFITSPVVTATPASGQVALGWTAADPGFGWAVSGYSTGYSAASGGPYTYSSVNGTLSATISGLSNGTTYYFIVRVHDTFGTPIATSSQVSSVPAASGGGGGGAGGGGGGSGSGGSGISYSSGGTVAMSGRAYPGSAVTILQDARVVATTIADANADFQVSVGGLPAARYLFSVYSTDSASRRSDPVSFPVTVTGSVTVTIGGIYLAPTIAVDKSEVRRGDDIAIFGQAASRSNVTIQVNSEQQIFVTAPADANGVYLYNFDTAALEYGAHSAKSKSATTTQVSPYGAAVGFKVGDKNVGYTASACATRGNLNKDCKVNLIDFSIMAYWYKRPGAPDAIDLNGDKVVNLADFSILAFNWTG